MPKIDYFQVVFTIPSKLSSLALGNRRKMYDLLFHSAWKALRNVVQEEQGFEAAAVMVLHTWNQKLEPHSHLHALVPGGGPSLARDGVWIKSRSRTGRLHDGPYLVDAKPLRKRFRELFLKGLKRLHQKGELKLTGDWESLQSESAFTEYLEPLERVDWVTYIEAPPSEDSKPEHVVKYLARYMTGGPISDRRLISHQDGDVTFYARTGEKVAADEKATSAPYTLSGTEFVRHWSMHILPKGYTKSRRYGGYSNHHRLRYLAECHKLLGVDELSPKPDPACTLGDEPLDPLLEKAIVCPKCTVLMTAVAEQVQPSWQDVMNGNNRPRWYEHG